jgi:pilus assembly protein Flp/PilA
MNQLVTAVKRFVSEEEGVTAIEYGLIAALIAVVIIAAITAVGTNLTCIFTRIADCLISPTTGTCGTECPGVG